MANRIAIIDADGVLFAAALKGETVCDGKQMQLLSEDAVYADCLARIETIVEEVEADECFLALSDRRNFRYAILDTYKGERKESKRPILLDALRARISEGCPHKVWLITGLEADDVCGIMADTFQSRGKETVVCSPDKDLLQIPGKLYQKGKVTEVTEEMALRWHVTQTLTGDVCDNYKGLKGWGPRRAGMLLDSALANKWTPAELWQAVIAAYVAAGFTEEDCLVQARVARILRLSDWDVKSKTPKLWNFPQ